MDSFWKLCAGQFHIRVRFENTGKHFVARVAELGSMVGKEHQLGVHGLHKLMGKQGGIRETCSAGQAAVMREHEDVRAGLDALGLPHVEATELDVSSKQHRAFLVARDANCCTE